MVAKLSSLGLNADLQIKPIWVSSSVDKMCGDLHNILPILEQSYHVIRVHKWHSILLYYSCTAQGAVHRMALALERASLALQERNASFSTPRSSPRVSPRDNASAASSPAAGLPSSLSPGPAGEPP